MSNRVLVCGGREYNDGTRVNFILDQLHHATPIDVIIQGEATGADTLAKEWAEYHGIPVDPFKAHWRIYGKRAGAMRNTQMLIEGKPDLVVAFPGNDGTADMVKQADKAGVPIFEVEVI